jgi:hypothetical protein
MTPRFNGTHLSHITDELKFSKMSAAAAKGQVLIFLTRP